MDKISVIVPIDNADKYFTDMFLDSIISSLYIIICTIILLMMVLTHVLLEVIVTLIRMESVYPLKELCARAYAKEYLGN